MPNIRIKDIPTTASATSSTDFIGIDGSANGTRKLNAFSPTFGGNLTVTGIGKFSGGGSVGLLVGARTTMINNNYAMHVDSGLASFGGVAGLGSIALGYNATRANAQQVVYVGATDSTNPSFEVLNASAAQIFSVTTAGNATLAGNLTVSGGTITGGTSGMSLAAGGTNQSITLTPSGTGATFISKNEANTNAITTALNYLKIQNTSSGGTYIGALEFYTWDNRRAAGIFANRNSVDGTSGILSFAYSTSGNSFAEGFRLNSTGNFLLGTTIDGGQKLQVAGVVNSSGAGYTNSGYQITNTTASRTTGWFQNNSGTTVLRDVTGAADLLSVDTSGNATFVGGIIGMTQGNVDNISDDGVASFTPLYNRGFIVINNPDYSQNALIAYFKAGSSYLLYSITKSADVTLNNSTTLTGTTGTDGKLNIGYNNSIIYIENRLGGIANFQRYALGGTN